MKNIVGFVYEEKTLPDSYTTTTPTTNKHWDSYTMTTTKKHPDSYTTTTRKKERRIRIRRQRRLRKTSDSYTTTTATTKNKVGFVYDEEKTQPDSYTTRKNTVGFVYDDGDEKTRSDSYTTTSRKHCRIRIRRGKNTLSDFV